MKTIKSYNDLQNVGLEKMALAAEADAGQALPGLRESLAEARAGVFAEVHTPAQIATRKRGRPVGSVKTASKVPTTLRLDPDVLDAFKASGSGWQPRMNQVLRSAVQRGKLTT